MKRKKKLTKKELLDLLPLVIKELETAKTLCRNRFPNLDKLIEHHKQ